VPERADPGRKGASPPTRPRLHDERLPVDPDLAPDDPGEPSLQHRPVHPPVHRSRQFGALGAIAAGGFIGTWARYEAGLVWPTRSGRFPWTTLAINTSGAFLLGLTLTVIVERLPRARQLRALLCTGVLGSWTTMSTLAVEADRLVGDGHGIGAAAYVIATVGLGLALASLGIALGRRFDVRGLR
jgi:CrcB protein